MSIHALSMFNKSLSRAMLLAGLAGVYGCAHAPVAPPVPGTSQVDSTANYHELLEAGITAYKIEELERAHDFFVRACNLDAEHHYGCLFRLELALELEDEADAIRALTSLAERWPETLAELRDEFMIEFLWSSLRQRDGDSAYRLLDAVWRADWGLFGTMQPDYLWMRLALMHSERGNADAAREVVAMLAHPNVMILIRADRRFDELGPVPASELPWNDVVDDYLARLYTVAEQQPTMLAPLVALTAELIAARRYHEALAITVKVMSDVERLAGAGDSQAFSDMDSQYHWILDHGALAMFNLGLWQEAVELQQEASRLLEDGQPNVSQAINLAGFHLALEQPREALAAIESVTDVSPYGLMQLELIRLTAALDLDDEPESRRALGYLSERVDDAPWTTVKAFLTAERMDEAAAALATALADPQHRAEILDQLQDYVRPAAVPRLQIWRDRVDALLARDDVQAAIQAVGRIESYDYCPPRCIF